MPIDGEGGRINPAVFRVLGQHPNVGDGPFEPASVSFYSGARLRGGRHGWACGRQGHTSLPTLEGEVGGQQMTKSRWVRPQPQPTPAKYRAPITQTVGGAPGPAFPALSRGSPALPVCGPPTSINLCFCTRAVRGPPLRLSTLVRSAMLHMEEGSNVQQMMIICRGLAINWRLFSPVPSPPVARHGTAHAWIDCSWVHPPADPHSACAVTLDMQAQTLTCCWIVDTSGVGWVGDHYPVWLARCSVDSRRHCREGTDT